MVDPRARGTPEAALAEMAWLRGLARQLVRDAHEAEDLVQETWVTHLRRSPRHLDGAPLRAWLARVARNLARRRRRDESLRRWHEEAAASERSGEGPEVERLQRQRTIAELVLGLREPYRTAVLLRYQEGASYASIARRQGVSQQAARQRVSRGLAMVRARLDERSDLGRHAWAPVLTRLFELDPPRSALPLAKVLLMGTKTIVALAAVTVGAVWWISSEGARPDSPSRSGAAVDEPVTLAGANEVPEGSREVASREDDGGGAAAPALDPLVVTVSSEAGLPLEGARVLLLPEEGRRPRVTTDAEGRATFEPVDAAGHVVAHAPSWRPAVLELEQLTGEQELILGAGARVSGRLLVDGAPPDPPLEISLASNDRPQLSLPDELEDHAADRLNLHGRAKAETTPDGSFAFGGLSERWSGHLLVPWTTHWFVEEPAGIELPPGDRNMLLLSEPLEGLVLNAIRLPCVRGRVVWADTGEPAERIRFSLNAELSGDLRTASLGSSTDEEGRFVMGIRPSSQAAAESWPPPQEGIEHVVLSFHSPDGTKVERELDGSELGPEGNVGEIRMPRTRMLHLVVRDPDGDPIAGAFAQPVAPGARGSRTNRLGRCAVPLAPGADHIEVGAPGQRVVLLPIGGGGASEDEPMEVVLPDGNELELRFVGPEGRTFDGLEVQLWSEGALYAGSTHWSRETVGVGGVDDTESGQELHEWLDEDGILHLSGFLDAVPLHLEVTDRFDQLLHEETFVGPSEGRSLVQTVTLPTAPILFEGRVVDRTGDAVPNVELWLSVGGNGKRDTTGTRGTFAFEGLHPTTEPGVLTLSHPGYATRRIEDLDLSGARPLDPIVLERGRQARVIVVDESGAPVDARLLATAEGFERASGYPTDPGVLLLEDLPPVPVTLKVAHGWREYVQTLASSDGTARFVLPVHGTLAVYAPAEAPVFENGGLAARVISLDGEALNRHAWIEDEGERALRHGPRPLVPGRYRVRLEHVWWADGVERSEVLSGEREVVIRPGEETAVRFGE